MKFVSFVSKKIEGREESIAQNIPKPMNSKMELSWQHSRRFFHNLGYLRLGTTKTASSYSMGLQRRHRDKNARNPDHPLIVHSITRTKLYGDMAAMRAALLCGDLTYPLLL